MSGGVLEKGRGSPEEKRDFFKRLKKKKCSRAAKVRNAVRVVHGAVCRVCVVAGWSRCCGRSG